MPIRYESPGRRGQIQVAAVGKGALTLLVLLNGTAPPAARRGLTLPRRTTALHALAAAAGIDPAVLAPLTRLSSGCYAVEDYLAQFDEDWEREEYGRHAAKVVSGNIAAWQSPASLVDALDALGTVLRDVSRASKVLPDDWPAHAHQAVGELSRAVRAAMADGATVVCLELDT